jgi:hypothetical protein
MAEFTFDRKAQRYRRSDGRFLAKKDMLGLLKQLNDKGSEAVRSTTADLIGKKIELSTWLDSIASTLKTSHIQQYLLGRGGEAMLTDDDYDQITDRVRNEFKYLKQFAQAIRDGKLSDAQIQARIQLYIGATDQTRKLAERQGHVESDYNEERRILAEVKHCPSCIGHAAKGWQPIGTLPTIGSDCECQSNCKCAFEYQRSAKQSAVLSPWNARQVVDLNRAVISFDRRAHR